jgi:hypothetical protein
LCFNPFFFFWVCRERGFTNLITCNLERLAIWHYLYST